LGVVVSPRFGLREKNKLRPIENLTFSGINNTEGLPEKLRVDTIKDCCYQTMDAGGQVQEWASLVKPTTYARLIAGWAFESDELDYAWISVWSPVDHAPRFFRIESLLFGAT